MKKFLGIAIIHILLFSEISYGAVRSGFARVEKLFLEGRYEIVISESRSLIDSRSSQMDELYYIKGLSELKLRRFDNARDSFEMIIKKFPRSKRFLDAYIGRADAYFLGDETPKAVTAYNEILNTFPDNSNKAIIYHRLGNCCIIMGQREKADGYFAIARDSAPNSFEVKSTNSGKSLIAASGNSGNKGQYSTFSTGGIKPNISKRPSSGFNSSNTAGMAGNFSVQVGSFKNMDNASNLAAKLTGEGFDSYVESLSSGDNLYRVKVGRLNSKDEALSLAGRLSDRGYNTSISVSE